SCANAAILFTDPATPGTFALSLHDALPISSTGALGAPGAILPIAVDQRLGARLATEHLLGLGHRTVLHVSGPLDWFDARERETGDRKSTRLNSSHVKISYAVSCLKTKNNKT